MLDIKKEREMTVFVESQHKCIESTQSITVSQFIQNLSWKTMVLRKYACFYHADMKSNNDRVRLHYACTNNHRSINWYQKHKTGNYLRKRITSWPTFMTELRLS